MTLYEDLDRAVEQPKPEPKQTNPALYIALVALLIASLTAALIVGERVFAGITSASKGAATKQSLYEPPDDLGALIAKVQRSTVTVVCEGYAQGSGWVIDLGDVAEDASPEEIAEDRKYPTEVITNHHVIEDCIDLDGSITVTSDAETFDAALWSWDEDNDLALIGIRQSPPALKLSKKPKPGWWAMALGTPYGLAGTVSLGNIMNTEGLEVITTTPLNSGNSGGPLINARGEVIGTNTKSRISDGQDFPEDWNVAKGLQALCDVLVACETPYWR